MEKKISGTFHGTALVVATIVGGGMFALPLALEQVWFVKGVLVLIICALFMLATGLMLVDVNLRFPTGTSFHTFTKELLGNKVNFIVGLSFIFVLYLITYAYISGASSALSSFIEPLTGARSGILSVILITLFVSAVIYKGGTVSGYVISFFVAAKFTTFIIATGGLVNFIHAQYLLDNPVIQGLTPYILTIPVCVVAFGFHGSIPSLIKMYGREKHKYVVRSLCLGVLISALIYIYWLSITMGVLDKNAFMAINQQGGNIGALIRAVKHDEQGGYLNVLLLFFASFAVISSLMSASLGLCDYLRDLITRSTRKQGALLPVLLTYFPPALFCMIKPDGFVTAIAWAGIALVIWSVLLPPVLLLRARKQKAPGPFIFPVGNSFLWLFFLLGIVLWLVMLGTV